MQKVKVQFITVFQEISLVRFDKHGFRENPASSTERVSGELGISQSSVIRHPHDLGKCIRSSRIIPFVTKISQFFYLP